MISSDSTRACALQRSVEFLVSSLKCSMIWCLSIVLHYSLYLPAPPSLLEGYARLFPCALYLILEHYTGTGSTSTFWVAPVRVEHCEAFPHLAL